jgi:hypothetical protein
MPGSGDDERDGQAGSPGCPAEHRSIPGLHAMLPLYYGKSPRVQTVGYDSAWCSVSCATGLGQQEGNQQELVACVAAVRFALR